MAKKKRYRGHYCKVCNSIVANEKFSGKGHSSHICKRCSKLPIEDRNEKIDFNRIYALYRHSNLSKVNKLMLQKYMKSGSEKVKVAAKEMFDQFYNVFSYRKLNEEYEGMMGIDTRTDEDLYEDQDYDYTEDLYSFESDLDSDSEDNDELPF